MAGSSDLSGRARPLITQARCFLTARDTGARLAEVESPLATVGGQGLPSVRVDRSAQFQTIQGFGGAFTEAAAVTWLALNDSCREQVLQAYFDRTRGHGYSLCRVHMGSCDFALGNYAHVEASDDMALGSFSIERDVLARIVLRLLADLTGLAALSCRSRRAVAAENLFLRRQPALSQERSVRPRGVDPATRVSLASRSRLFDWRDALVVVRPKTLIRWHRAGWRLFGRLKSRPGGPPIPLELRRLIRRMATENPLWGESGARSASPTNCC